MTNGQALIEKVLRGTIPLTEFLDADLSCVTSTDAVLGYNLARACMSRGWSNGDMHAALSHVVNSGVPITAEDHAHAARAFTEKSEVPSILRSVCGHSSLQAVPPASAKAVIIRI